MLKVIELCLLDALMKMLMGKGVWMNGIEESMEELMGWIVMWKRNGGWGREDWVIYCEMGVHGGR